VAAAAVTRMIATVVDAMFTVSDANRLLEVSYANGENEILYFKDFASGAMIESIVRRAKKLALKRYIERGEKGLTADDLVAAVREEFRENEDLPNTSNPDDWAKIAGRKRERIISIKLVLAASGPKTGPVERVVTTGQYL
jgi:proteasome-associated ATPase